VKEEKTKDGEGKGQIKKSGAIVRSMKKGRDLLLA